MLPSLVHRRGPCMCLRFLTPFGNDKIATIHAHPTKDLRVQVSAVLGDMERTAGMVRITGSIAYVAQSAWITNDTVQGNITFGKPFDRERYNRVVEATSLEHDFKVTLPGQAWLAYCSTRACLWITCAWRAAVH